MRLTQWRAAAPSLRQGTLEHSQDPYSFAAHQHVKAAGHHRSASPLARRRRGELADGQVDVSGLVIHRECPCALLRRHLLDERIRVRRVLVEDRERSVAAARDVDQSLRRIELERIRRQARSAAS